MYREAWPGLAWAGLGPGIFSVLSSCLALHDAQLVEQRSPFINNTYSHFHVRIELIETYLHKPHQELPSLVKQRCLRPDSATESALALASAGLETEASASASAVLLGSGSGFLDWEPADCNMQLKLKLKSLSWSWVVLMVMTLLNRNVRKYTHSLTHTHAEIKLKYLVRT